MLQELSENFAASCRNTIVSGRCQANCCGFVSLPKELVQLHKDKMEGEVLQMRDEGDEVTCITKDRRCVFLDRKTLACKIYDDRPDVCMKFGLGLDFRNGNLVEEPLLYCPFIKPNGNPWSPAKAKQLEKRVKVILARGKEQYERMHREQSFK
jgi:hypothetical protein